MLEQKFYEEDVKMVAGSFDSDPEIKKMQIHLANMADYHGHKQKFIDYVEQVLSPKGKIKN